MDVVVLIITALLARGWHGGPAELTLGHGPSGVKQPGSFNGASLLAKNGFHWDFNPQSPEDPSVLLAQPEPATCFIPAQRMQGDEAISKEQGFSIASRLTVTSFGKMLALPSFSRGGERQHEDKSLVCAGLIPLLPTDRVPRAAGAGGDPAGAVVGLEPFRGAGSARQNSCYLGGCTRGLCRLLLL